MKINSTKFHFFILYARTTYFGDVAQLVEQGPFKAKVPGSNPGISTILYVVNPFLKIEGIFKKQSLGNLEKVSQ